MTRRERAKSPSKADALASHLMLALAPSAGAVLLIASPAGNGIAPARLVCIGTVLALAYFAAAYALTARLCVERERAREQVRRGGKAVLGMPPKRTSMAEALDEASKRGAPVLDKYLVGFELETGEPLWVDDEAMCQHGAVFAKTGVGKTLWLESLVLQQMARGRAGCTFIDAKRDSDTLAHIILMALATGRIDDLIVIDPFEPVHAYNFVLTAQRADVKARKVLRAGLPPTPDGSTTKHYDRLAADSVYRLVRAVEACGCAWSVRDIAAALSTFQLAYPRLREMLEAQGARDALVELGHLASTYRTPRGTLDTARMTDNLRGIAAELHSLAGSEAGRSLCCDYTDLVLTDAIAQGKIVYLMVPRLEEAETAARIIKLFREDLEVSIGEITSSRQLRLDDPHLVIVDEGASTFGPTWANLFELSRKGRFALMFGAQSAGALTDGALGLSRAFYERVMANVNLKVLMRVGDNTTASDMAEWFGKVLGQRRTVGESTSVSHSHAPLRGPLDAAGRRVGAGSAKTVSFAEQEQDLVSADELKHEMASEKGLAWFDMGDGRIVKGRALWFDAANIPRTWDGREWLPRFVRKERPALGLADWVDEEVLRLERERAADRVREASPAANAPVEKQEPKPAVAEAQNNGKAAPFRIDVNGPKRPRRAVVRAISVRRNGETRRRLAGNGASDGDANQREIAKND